MALGDVVEGGSSDLLRDVGVYVELHVEQGRDLVDRGAAVGVASAIWPHGRYRFDIDRPPPTTPAPRGWRTGTTRC